MFAFLAPFLLFTFQSLALNPIEILKHMARETHPKHLVTLKNGVTYNQVKVAADMAKLLELATNQNAEINTKDALIALAKKLFCNKLIETQSPSFEVLRTKRLINAQGDIQEKTLPILLSALHFHTYHAQNISAIELRSADTQSACDPALADFTLIRSPLKGRYMAQPLFIGSETYNVHGNLAHRIHPHLNTQYCVNIDPRIAEQLFQVFSIQYRLETEETEDSLPYSYVNSSWQHYGFASYEDYLGAIAQAYIDNGTSFLAFHDIHRNAQLQQCGFATHRAYLDYLMQTKPSDPSYSGYLDLSVIPTPHNAKRIMPSTQ